MSATADAKPVATTTAASLDPDILATVIEETARRVEARAARPSPIHLRSWQEIERFAEKAAKSGMVPKDYNNKPDAICIAVQLGSELGLAPMQSVQNIAVINGRPSLWGDAMIGLCRASGMATYIKEWSEGEGDAITCYCEAKRKDDPTPVRKSFSVADAKRAGLWKDEPKTKKQGRDGPYEVDSGPWYSYPQRMLQMRARGFALRDAFPDVLKGLMTAEEARDIPWDDTGLSIGMPPVASAETFIMPARPRPSEMPPASRREQINEAVPMGAAAATSPPTNGRRRTISDWLTAFEIAARDAQNAEDANRVICSDEAQMMKERVTGDAKARYDAVIHETLKRWFSVPPDTEAELPEVEIAGEERLAAG